MGGGYLIFLKIKDPRKFHAIKDVRKNWKFSIRASTSAPEENRRNIEQVEVKATKDNKQGTLSKWTKTEYLNLPCVKGFVDYIRSIEESKSLNHSYNVVDVRWEKYPNVNNKGSVVHINSLQNALDQYFWPTIVEDEDYDEDKVSFGTASFEDNAKVLLNLKKLLRNALDTNDKDAVFVQSIKILNWGQVYRGAVGWLIERYEVGTLVSDIKSAIEILDGDKSDRLSAFQKQELRIDSGLTKVYSLGSNNSIIYDDRVGAALGLLARGYLSKVGWNSVPPELNFMRGRNNLRAWYRINRRQTMIKHYELAAWYESVMNLKNDTVAPNREAVRDFLLLLLFTGLRRSEATRLTWSRVDFRDRTLKVTDTKNHTDHVLPLTDFLYDLLAVRKSRATTAYVFANELGKGGLTDPKKQIRNVVNDSGVSFSAHDLRRTFITIAESLDISVYALKRLLNHKMTNDVTAGYIITDVYRLRVPMQKITDYILLQFGLKTSASIHPLQKLG